jgi:hypothetical protein
MQITTPVLQYTLSTVLYWFAESRVGVLQYYTVIQYWYDGVWYGVVCAYNR